MTKPVCINCKRFFKPERNGVFVLEQMPCSNGAAPGTSEEEHWKPYKIWRADLYKCRGCQRLLITGFAQQPISEHYKSDFALWLEMVEFTVNDC